MLLGGLGLTSAKGVGSTLSFWSWEHTEYRQESRRYSSHQNQTLLQVSYTQYVDRGATGWSRERAVPEGGGGASQIQSSHVYPSLQSHLSAFSPVKALLCPCACVRVGTGPCSVSSIPGEGSSLPAGSFQCVLFGLGVGPGQRKAVCSCATEKFTVKEGHPDKCSEVGRLLRSDTGND